MSVAIVDKPSRETLTRWVERRDAAGMAAGYWQRVGTDQKLFGNFACFGFCVFVLGLVVVMAGTVTWDACVYRSPVLGYTAAVLFAVLFLLAWLGRKFGQAITADVEFLVRASAAKAECGLEADWWRAAIREGLKTHGISLHEADLKSQSDNRCPIDRAPAAYISRLLASE